VRLHESTPRSYNVEINVEMSGPKRKNSMIIAKERRKTNYKTVKCLLTRRKRIEENKDFNNKTDE